jgi:uncharacterized protein (TIGR02145 family)
MILPKDERSFVDTSITNIVYNTFNYRLSAFAGNNNSSSILVDFIVGAPTVTTTNITNTTQISATGGGNVTSDGGANVTAGGVCWSINQNPTITDSHTIDGTGTGVFISSLTGLTANTLYYVRAYTTNSVGTSYGSQVSFTTLPMLVPTVTTTAVTDVTQTTATSGGNVTSDGGGTVTDRGVCYSTNQNPTTTGAHTTDGTGTGLFISSLTGLSVNTLFYVRAFATNVLGTAYGDNISFTTLGPVTDIDGNVYYIALVGTQVWMAENLKVTNYRNGEPITNVTDGSQWSNLSSGAYCWYNNNISNKNDYGALYNNYTVVDSRNLCPTGWHIPSDAEWTILANYLGGNDIAGGKMKETGYFHWQTPNTDATNESGLRCLPGGTRGNGGGFTSIGFNGLYWSSTEDEAYYSWYRNLYHGNGNMGRYVERKEFGFSVRCIKD